MILGPFVGVWVNRWKRKIVIICADLFIGLATVFAAIFLLGEPPYWSACLVLGIRALGVVFHTPAIQAAIHLGLAGLAVSTFLCGVLPPDRWAFWVFVPLCALMGASGNLYNILYVAYMQETIPHEAQGRAFSVMAGSPITLGKTITVLPPLGGQDPPLVGPVGACDNHPVALINGDYQVLLHHQDPFAAECFTLLTSLCYQPKIIVEYLRQAFVAPENSTCITFDQRLQATQASLDLLCANLPMYPAMEGSQVILEVKYNHFLLSHLKALLGQNPFSEMAASKYAMARTAVF